MNLQGMGLATFFAAQPNGQEQVLRAGHFSTQRKAILYGLAAVLAWSTVATAFKLALRHLDVYQLLFLADLFSLAALALVLVVQGKLALLGQVKRLDFLVSGSLGLLNPLIYYLILFRAYDLLPAQVAQPLNYTWALMLAYLSVPLLKQRLRRQDVIAGLICYGGAAVIATGGDFASFSVANPMGVILALVSTVIWALYWIAGRRSRLDPVVSLFLGFLCAIPFAALIVGLKSTFSFPSPGVWGALYVGCVEMGFTFVLWMTAMRLTSSTVRIANLIFLSPFLSLVFIQFVLKEQVVPATMVGLLLIVGGLWWQGRPSRGETTQ